MAEDTAISTPEKTSVVDTSANTVPDTVNTDVNVSETAAAEPTLNNETAENDNQTETNSASTETKLYANKYKSVEELEKGYSEAQKMISKASEFEKKYNELLNKQSEQEAQLQAQRLKQAQQQGYNSVESAEIANAVTLAEFNLYADGIRDIAPEDYETVREHLINYYNTGNKGYLEEAKRYFSSGFIEKVALQKQRMTNDLQSKYAQKQRQMKDESNIKLANTLKEDFGDFLSDVNDNTGKSDALKIFCNAGFINSKEDMNIFKSVYDRIAQVERAKAIKEYEAQKAIETAKQGSQIEGTAGNIINSDGMPTAEQIERMTQAEYNAAYEKYGDKLIQQYMKR
ncbi:MAG: hypothetical protein LUH05_03985 [Candidatus Gastranaerophilales bacterium]|nr:hypothetical protein [Candidatus Gastranaerophilales bacterium]